MPDTANQGISDLSIVRLYLCSGLYTILQSHKLQLNNSCERRLAGLAQRKADPVGLWQQQQQQGASKTNSLAADLESIAQSGTTFTTSQGAAAGKLPSTAGAAASATLGLLGAALLTNPLLPPQFWVSTSHAAICLGRAQLLACCQTQTITVITIVAIIIMKTAIKCLPARARCVWSKAELMNINAAKLPSLANLAALAN